MFFDLSFPKMDPWTDLDELLACAEQPDDGTDRTPPGRGGRLSPAPVSAPPTRRGDGECAAAHP